MLTLTTATSSRNNDTNATSNITITAKAISDDHSKSTSRDQTRGHVCLFIRDVTSSSSYCSTIENNDNNNNNNNNNNSNNSDIFKTRNGIVYQRVRLNGILVSQSNEKMNIWLDDGTDTIRAILSPRLLARADAPKLTISASVTVFGLVKYLDNEFVIQCGGFHIETDISNELYHSIKVLSQQASLSSTSTKTATKVNRTVTASEKEDKENINMNNKNATTKNTKETNNSKIAQKPAALFQSLSSQPSPPPSNPIELILSTPEQKKPSSRPITTPTSSLKTGAATEETLSQFAWSPEQPLATSTPLVKDSPLKIQSNKNKNNQTPNNNHSMVMDDDDDDMFGELDISYSRIEREATTGRSKPQKRRWEP